MIFNLQKNNTRNSIDINDYKGYVLYLLNTTKHLDRPTLAVVAETLSYISKVFDSMHPREKEVYYMPINEYNLTRQLRKVYRKNLKLSKKKHPLEFEEITPPPNPEDVVFNQKQLKQLEESIKAPLNATEIAIQGALLEVTKKILASLEKPAEKPKKKDGQASAKKNS